MEALEENSLLEVYNSIFLIHFPGYDQSHFSGSLTYVPLANETYWEFALDDVLLGGLRTVFTFLTVVRTILRILLWKLPRYR